MSDRRATDPENLDADSLRREVAITVSRDDLEATLAVSRSRAFLIAVFTALFVAAVTAAAVGWFASSEIAATVRHDVGRAAIRNCDRTSRAASVGPVLKSFLTTDAAFNATLGRLDRESARIDRDLSAQVRKLGARLPPQIAQDYFAQSRVFQELALKRAGIADLWAGPGARHGGKTVPSLADAVLLVAKAHCDDILSH